MLNIPTLAQEVTLADALNAAYREGFAAATASSSSSHGKVKVEEQRKIKKPKGNTVACKRPLPTSQSSHILLLHHSLYAVQAV